MLVSVFVAVPVTANAASPDSGGPGGTGSEIGPGPAHVSVCFDTQPYAIEGLVANGTYQALINEGTTSAGTAYYYMTTEDITGDQANSLFEDPSKPGSFSTEIPKGRDAGTYYIWFAIDGGSNYTDLLPYMEINNQYESHKLTVTIAAPTYTVTWKNADGTTLKTDTDVAEGTTPTYDGTPEKAEDENYTYTFAGWTPEITDVTGDVTYTAQYRATFKGITSDDIYEGLVIDAGTPIKFMIIKSGEDWRRVDLSVYLDGTLVKELVTQYSSKTEPDRYYTTTKKCIVDSYDFSRGDPSSHVLYLKSVYDVPWKNDDGTVLKTEDVAKGDTPSYGATPTKAEDENNTYTFSGWTPEITAVTGDTEYTAQFTAVPKPKKLTLNVGENGKVVMDNGTFGNATDASNIDKISALFNVAYDSKFFIVDDHTANLVEGGSINIATGGEVSFYPSADNTGVITAIPAEGYVFAGWYNGDTLYSSDAALSYQNISENITLTATFTAVPKYDYITNGNVGYRFLDTVAKGVDDALAEKNNYTSLCNFKLLGVQKKVESDELDSESKTDVRFVSVVNTDILRDADEYGYIFAKAGSKDEARDNVDKIVSSNAKVLTVPCTESSNTISGAYGDYNADTNYKYVTATVNGIGDSTVAARFYIKKGDNYYYADYTNQDNQTYTVCATAFSDLG